MIELGKSLLDADQNQRSLQVDTQLPVLACKVGWLIGKNGNFIASLRERTGCEIHIDTNTPQQDLGRAWINVRMRGSRRETDRCMKIIMARLDYMQTLLSSPLEGYGNDNCRPSNRQVPPPIPGHGHSSGDGNGNGNGHSAPGEYSVWEPSSPKVQELEPTAEGGSDGGRPVESPGRPPAAMEADEEEVGVEIKADIGVGPVAANHLPSARTREPSSVQPAAGEVEASEAQDATWREAGSEKKSTEEM